MRRQLARWGPLILAGLLVVNLIAAVTAQTRTNWITVALVAIALAAALWRPPRAGA